MKMSSAIGDNGPLLVAAWPVTIFSCSGGKLKSAVSQIDPTGLSGGGDFLPACVFIPKIAR
jgi:hypothetical protein